MILHEFAPAPNPRRVRIFLNEKGIDIATEQIDIMKGEHKKDDYKKMSPLSQVPTLELDEVHRDLLNILLGTFIATFGKTIDFWFRHSKKKEK